jgi:putative FmdB family regulatory protein
MPIYEYRCPNGHTFEVFQRMTDPAVERCQECGAGPVEKVLFPVAVHFKGSGFYSTDYGRGGRKAVAKEGESGSSDTSEKTDKVEKKDPSSGSSTGSGDSSPKKSD